MALNHHQWCETVVSKIIIVEQMTSGTVIAVGMRFRGSHVFSPDDNLHLEKEPDNKYDSNAVKVMLGTQHVAYIRREDAPALANLSDSALSKLRLTLQGQTDTFASFSLHMAH